MSIDRQNIFDLIGKDQSRYGHCLMTTFSFDYGFFEQRVLRALRSANIRNVNVFTDAGYLDELLEELALADSSLQQSYSLIPIQARGVFHPKIMMLIGPKQGLLVIGSGNISSSGMSSNDEVWGAFHVNGIESPNAPLFAAAWNYLKRFVAQAEGIHQTKLQWIYQTVPWITELEKVEAGAIVTPEGLSISLIANDDRGNIFTKLTTAIKDKEVLKLTVIAPYFDRDGLALSRLQSQFNPQECVVISDTEFGLLPDKMDQNWANQLSAYDWPDVITDKQDLIKRLHAKMFHFKLVDGGEYLLLGSANATQAALGIGNGSYLNEEAGLLIFREGDGDYLTELGIDLSEANVIQFTKDSGKANNKGDSRASSRYKLKIRHAEQVGNKLQLFLNQNDDSAVKVGVFRNLREQPEYVLVKAQDAQISTELKGGVVVNFCALYNDKERISSYAPVNNVDQLYRTNPDDRFKDITRLADVILRGEEDGLIGDLLSHAQFNYEDDEFDVERGRVLKRGANRAVVQTEKEYEKIDSITFNQASSIQQIQNEIHTKSGLVADILHQLSKGLKKQREEPIADAEQLLTIDQESGTEGTSVEQLITQDVVIDGKRERNAVIGFLSKIEKWFTDNLNGFISSGDRIDSPNRSITLKELQNVSSALSLLIYYQGKSYRYSKTQFPMRVIHEHLGKIEKLVKKHGLIRVDGQLHGYPDAALFEVISGDFQKVRKELEASILREKLPSILIDQSEYKLSEYVEPYLNDGAFLKEGDYSGIKGFLFFLLGRFLINANEKAGFKAYESAYVVDKVEQERMQIFTKSIFLLLNLHWMEREYRYFDLLVLSLLHNLMPFETNELELSIVNQELNDYYQKATKKNSDFNKNKQRFESLLNQYTCWFDSYSDDRKPIQKDLSDIRGNQIVFHSQIGFSLLIEKGSESIWISLPGLNYDHNKKHFTIRMKYRPSTILTFPAI